MTCILRRFIKDLPVVCIRNHGQPQLQLVRFPVLRFSVPSGLELFQTLVQLHIDYVGVHPHGQACV